MNKTQATILAALLLVATQACQQTQEHSETADRDSTASYCISEDLLQTTLFHTVQQEEIKEQLSFSGKVAYNENDLVAFRSLIAGQVDQVYVELGDKVKKGQVLALVKSVEVQSLFQGKRYQENQVALLQKQLANKTALLKDGLLSEPEVLATSYELEAAQIELEKIKASLLLYKATSNGNFQLLAPKDGYIVQKNISAGQAIQSDAAEDPLFSISNLKEVWVMVNIHASNLPDIKLNAPAQVKTVAYPDRVYQGHIDKIYNVFDDDEHVLKARVVLANQDLHLLPGLSADILIDKPTKLGKATAIPNKAKIFHNNKEYIVLYNSKCDLKVQQITAIAENEQYTYIQEPLKDQQQIVSKNALLLFEQLIP